MFFLADLLEKEAQVSAWQQETEHTCSAACLKAVLASYGVDLPEPEVAAAIGVSPRFGAEVTQIADGARKLGFEAFTYDFSSLDQAKLILDTGISIICDFQSFNHPGKGHYVVMDKVDSDRVYIMDPNTKDGINRRVLTREHADARWWDWTMAKPHLLKVKWGVIVLPPEASR